MPDPRPFPIPLAPIGERPLVSVFMPNFNYEEFVGDAMRSVLSQSYETLELVVVDDGSTDRSPSIISAIAERDDRVRFVPLSHVGQVAVFNTGYAHCRGDIVCILDSDDVFEPGKIAKVVDAFRRLPVGLVQHPMRKIDADGRKLVRIPRFAQLDHGWLAERAGRPHGKWRITVSSALAFRREALELITPVPDDVGFPDGYLTLLVPFLTRIGVIQECLTLYRVHDRNVSATGQLELESLSRIVAALVSDVTAANRRLAELGIGVQIDLRHNTVYPERKLQQRLLDPRSSRGDVAGAMFEVLWSIARDPHYPLVERLVLITTYGVAWVLSLEMRRRWLAGSRSPLPLVRLWRPRAPVRSRSRIGRNSSR